MRLRAYLCAVLVLLLCAGQLGGQTDVSSERPKELTDVKDGMPRDAVLGALAERYKLKKVSLPGESELEIWSAVSNESHEWGEIIFRDGKVAQVNLRVVTTNSGDAVKLVRELFRQLYFGASPVVGKDEVERMFNPRSGVAQVRLEEFHLAGDMQRITLVMGNQDLRLEVQTGEGEQPLVSLVKSW